MKKAFALILLVFSVYSVMAQTNNTRSKPNKGKIIAPRGGQSSMFPLAGTWTLKAAEVILPDGTHITDPGLGKDAKGVLMIDAEGQYSLQIFKTDRPKFASGDKKRGTPGEYASALLGLSTHAGHIKIDTAKKLLQFDIDYAAYPNWEHTSQTRQYTLKGDELYYQLPANAGAGTIAASIWTRVRSK
ncbi:lipocalin-like domain-containing protein [Mucilaginibacter gilvus]|uniref:Lipocalin-like domain protein n=1 Tax=Mucilaginibacter gilvus TaxID=2305909 RepID=A0A3S3VIP4_9SPHI|nr:lipocalin-like domain-containing protein [Mucilaginibacter gilvus]RWY49111.1 lipocalin-like domain protein [Mucilaginibacter gilvus]